MATEHDKLVRDKIPAIITADGNEAITHVADEAEYRERLVDKLDEEVAEFRASRDPGELVDILEVVHAIRELHGITAADLAAQREAKATERGRFEERFVLERVEE